MANPVKIILFELSYFKFQLLSNNYCYGFVIYLE